MEEKDGSYFFLLEDSADSELDKMKWHQDQRVSGEDDQEDAQSCSCADDTSERSALGFQDDGDGDANDLNGLRASDPPQSGLTMSFSGAAAGGEYETTDQEEESSNVGVMNEMVQMEDKLFWEACMAGGYP